MKSLCIILLSVIPSLIFCQVTKELDSLFRYSHEIIGLEVGEKKNLDGIGHGTGFFIKMKNDLFLITARHVLFPCGFFGQKQECHFDKFVVFDSDSSGISFEHSWRFSIVDLHINQECSPFYESLDISMVQKDTNQKYFSLNRSWLPQKLSNNSSIVAFGFHSEADAMSGLFTTQMVAPMRSSNNIIDSNFLILDPKGHPHRDTLNYRVIIQDFKVTSKLKGYSGSPVFVNDSSTNKWKLLGVFSAIDPALNALYLVKAKYLFE